MNFQPPDPPEEDEGERFERELSELQRAAENLVAIDAGKSDAHEGDAVVFFNSAARPSLIVWMFEDRQRQADEYDKAWRHDLVDKNNVQVLADEMVRLSAENTGLREQNAKLRQIISECATACGAAVSVECSIEFMQLLPGEITLMKTLCDNRGKRLAVMEQRP